MEKKSKPKKETLLPTSLLNDIEYDELDKELQLSNIFENNDFQKKCKNNLYYLIFNYPLAQDEIKDSSIKLNEKASLCNNINLLYFNENLIIPNQLPKNENVIFNTINTDKNDLLQNERESNYLNYDFHSNYINDFNPNLNIAIKAKPDKIDIVSLLKNNSDISSYAYIIDHLSYDDFLKMFSFILKNIMIFISNSQGYQIINKIISLYNSSPLTFNDIQKNNIEYNFNENIFAFLTSFFDKRIIYLINSNNYINTVIYFVQKIGYPKNDFVFSEIKKEFKKYATNRQGCILIQNLFPLGNDIQKQNFFGEILDKYNDLIVDRYGHYLFKYLLYKAENGEKYYSPIYNKIVYNLKKYTSNKYSSVIIERLLDSFNEDIKNKIIDKICKNENDVVELVYHSYGNYVLQKIISVTKDNNVLGMIYKTIMKNKNSIYKLSYGKKIMKEISVAYTLK